MVLVVGFVVVGLVIAIAAFVVAREATRIAKAPPPALFDLDDAFEWVMIHLPDWVAATLTPADVHRILGYQLEFFGSQGVSTDGSDTHPVGPVVIGGGETIEYIFERSAAAGDAYLPEQIEAVLETQLTYLRAIGAVGPRAGFGDDPDPDENLPPA